VESVIVTSRPELPASAAAVAAFSAGVPALVSELASAPAPAGPILAPGPATAP